MNFLFKTTIHQRGLELNYNVFEFKLHPGKYKAELTTPESSRFMKEIIFWKEREKWKVQPPLESALNIVEQIGKDIDHQKQ
jgi:hypothetical protein